MDKTQTLMTLGDHLKSDITDFNFNEDQSLECLTLHNEILTDVFLQKLSLYTSLKRLFIHDCKIKSTNFLNNLSELEEIEIIDCELPRIKTLKLENLTRLHINRCSIKNIDFLKDCKNLEVIILQGNKIQNINVLETFSELGILNLSGNEIRDISTLKYLMIKVELDLSQNKISDFSPLYNEVKHGRIHNINFSGNPSNYPPENTNLYNKYTYLDWFDEIYSVVQDKIMNAKKEEYEILDLGSMGITDLSYFPELFELKHLRSLILSNEWSSYNDDIDDWDRNISINNVYPNNLTSIPPNISKLINLEYLVVGGDWNLEDKSNPNKWRIKKIDNLKKLKKLKGLNVSNNMITNVDVINDLEELEDFHANNNLIRKIKKLKPISKLRDIYLSNNLIEDVNFFIENKSLRTVDLHSNKITDLIPLKDFLHESNLNIEVTSWKRNVISVNGNRNSNPPLTALEGGKKSFFLYASRYEREMKLKLTEYVNTDVKIIFAGNSNSGKSTLLDYLLYGKVNKKIKTTQWIETQEYLQKIDSGNEVRFKFFDLGGQDYYHDTHNLFFDKDSIYLVMWENETNSLQSKNDGDLIFQNYPLEYWLDCIRIHSQNSSEMEQKIDKLLELKQKVNNNLKNLISGGDLTKKNDGAKIDEKNQNILIIQSKTEQSKVFLNQYEYKRKYSSIKDFINISLYNEKGLEHLKDILNEMVKENVNFNRKMLYTWGLIKENFGNIVTEEYVLNIDDLVNMFNTFIELFFETTAFSPHELRSIMFDREDVINFAMFLNNIGYLIYRPNVDENLVIVNQKKFIGKTKEVIEDAKLNNGKIKLKHDKYLLQVLKDLEIIFENESHYFFPLYLPEKPLKVVDILLDNNNLPLRKFKFNGYIPKNIILKLFSKFSNRVSPSNSLNNFYFWKNGLILIDDLLGDKFYLKFDIDTKSNYSFIDLFCLDQHKLSNNHSNFIEFIKEIFLRENLKFYELITNDGEFYADLEIVSTYYEKGINFIEINDLNNNFKIINTHLYNNFIRENLKKNMKKIFISYSKYDDDYRKEFIKHLITLKDDGLISEFNCESIDLGDNSHEVIQRNLEECDYMIALVSVDFLNTDYIRKFEIKRAIELNKRIIPIIIKPCDWQNSVVKDFHATLRGTNISLDKKLFLNDEIKETTPIERQQNWTNIIKEFREKLFSKN